MYGCNTQLIIDETIVDGSNISRIRLPLPPSDVHLVATQLVEEQSSAKTGIHDEETQVVDLPELLTGYRHWKSRLSTASDVETTAVFHNGHQYHYSQEPSTSRASDNKCQIVEDSFHEVNTRCSIVVEDSFDNMSKVSDDLLVVQLER
nr:unnamed protein product [Callosobruchus analis]